MTRLTPLLNRLKKGAGLVSPFTASSAVISAIEKTSEVARKACIRGYNNMICGSYSHKLKIKVILELTILSRKKYNRV